MRISISIKIIILMFLFLVGTTAFFAQTSSSRFESVLTSREEDSNLATVTGRLKEVDASLLSIKERVEVIGTLLAKQAQENLPRSKEIEINFNKDKELVSLEIYKISGKGIERIAREVKMDVLKNYKLPENYIDYVRKYSDFPFQAVAEKGIEVVNSSFPKGPPLITIGIPVLQDEFGNVSHIAVADLDLGVLQKPFAQRSERTLFLTDKNGSLIAHQDEQRALARMGYAAYPIVAKAIKDSAKLPQQTRFTDPETKKILIGAYAKSAFGVIAFSQVDLERILEPAKAARNDAIKIAGTMMAIAFFFSFLFSISLTSPLEKLADLIKIVSKGNFDVRAVSVVKSKDEVGDLAKAFDEMTLGLKERDKVKNLFSKFHGSSVAEDLIKNDIGVGGQNKDVTIFFSDIRGFTAFSEKRSPEQVVEMLNEYFSVMVGIINKNGGVVDKFIGDAIMAVWGAPQTSPDDTLKAVSACLQMRTALLELNTKREAAGEPPIMIGMGLHCGRAISGTIGSQERMEYTVIGDTVNMTSRIESSTKAFGADLLVSEDVVAKVGESYVFELGGAAEVKGKSEPLKMFKVRGYKHADGTTEIIKTPYSDYEKGDAEKVKVTA
jgi:adenylate cyclase